ncbi:MAG: hypothetical protein K6G87_00460 [Butyrivibrio sp.]|uniref:hypothetical protein n=1 Tax=Butyrivibrio sp. TaxID=28121 RepID=UPI0025D2B4EA|nr:hypothetical protein [Butyrivibrio sp.]MCR5769682.1 hypothetical protein [Butyrivibrio sp.]
MKIQSESRFKDTSGTEKTYIEEFIVSDYKIFDISNKDIPKYDQSIISSKGSTRESLLPDIYKEKRLAIRNYSNNTVIRASAFGGRVWILLGVRKGKKTVSLNVGQSRNIVEELEGILWDVMIKQKGAYSEELKNYDKFIFYEVNMDSIISIFTNKYEVDLKEIAYGMVKDYFSEVIVAHDTLAKNWNCYNAGMDNRFLSYLCKEHSELYTFDRSKGEKSE